MSRAAITANMRVSEVLTLVPEAAELLKDYGLGCAGCAMGSLETLGEGCCMHGWNATEIAELVTALNALVAAAPARPQSLTLTREAARELRTILVTEGKHDHILAVVLDPAGGFCMEFLPALAQSNHIFTHPEEPNVAVTASSQVLQRIGGAIVDYREGRFKLDLPESREGGQ